MNANYFQEVLFPMHIALNKSGLYTRVRGDWQVGDEYCLPSEGTFWTYKGVKYDWLDNATRIPRTIDDNSPEARERSLWGMCDGIIAIEDSCRLKCWQVRIDTDQGSIISGKGATPTEAILKVLCHQEGIEL
jgi:hypothetical protein